MPRKFSHDEVFKQNSLYPRHRLKPRLLELGVPYKCNECGISHWNGKPISLHLDHKNGIYNDNRFDNLRFLCPNCHSQTDTYAGKNTRGIRGAGRKDSVKPNFRAEKLKRDKLLWEEIKSDLTIPFGKWGWIGEVASRLNISPQKVKQWIMRVDPDFYRSLVSMVA